jgi:polysaccharide export outer membrane protein
VERDLGLDPGTLKKEKEAGYQAGPGDVIVVTFTSHPKLSQEATVTPDGNLVLTLIGSIPVEGRGADEIKAAIVKAAEAAGVRNPELSVSVKSAAPRHVTFIAPGLRGSQVEIVGGGTLLEALGASGWKPEGAGQRRVAVIRAGRTSIIDLDQITGLREVDLNIRLRPNDILIAMSQDPFEVQGAVAKPGRYAVPPSGRIGLQDAIAMAGGLKFPVEMSAVRILRRDGRTRTVNLNRYLFQPELEEPVGIAPGDTAVPERFGAVLSECKVVRGYPKEPEVIQVDVDALMGGDTAQDITMRDGDVLFVPESWGSDVLDTVNRILAPLAGAVQPTVQVYTASQMRR